MNKHSLISVVIPTYNSENTLRKSLSSIKYQSYPRKKIEILIVDGGSTDKTLQIAKQYGCKVLHNPKVDLIYGKYLGFLKSSGEYLMFLDSDEVLENKNSLSIKITAFEKNRNVRAAILSGYKTPNRYPAINFYINEFGDPYSFFMYRESKGYNYLVKAWSRKYSIIQNDTDFIVFDFTKIKDLPLIELWAGGCMIDLKYSKLSFPNIKNNPALLAHLFYLINSRGGFIAVSKNDYTIHYSVNSFQKYLKKLSSRIKNNIFQTEMGYGGFSGRKLYHSFLFALKRYLFVPYSITLFLPLLDSFYLSLTRKRPIYLIHVLLCIHTSSLIVYYYLLKLFGIKPKIKSYGN